MASPGKRILHFGLAGPSTTQQRASGMTTTSVQDEVRAGAQKAREAGYHVQLTFVEPETFAASLSEAKNELASGTWDALLVGGGIRVAPALTPQFEQLVNTSRVVAPDTKILFQAAPGDAYEAIKRGFE